MTLRWVFAALLGAILLTFQNCTQPAPMEEVDANSVLSEKMAFSYDATLDQLAYMSCPNVVTADKRSVDSDLYFTFRAGAYRFGGLKLKESFFKTYQKKLPERMISLLQHSRANSGTVLQLAVRQSGNLNSIVVNGQGNPAQNIDFANLLAVLGSSELSTNLVNTGLDLNQDPPVMTQKRIKYLRDGTGRGAHLEGNLNFGSSENMQASLRNTYMGTGSALLALTYLEPASTGSDGGGPSTDTDVRNPGTIGVTPDPDATPPPSTPGLAFGTGFQMTFGQPVANARGLQERHPTTGAYTGVETLPYPSNVVTSVIEKDLLTGAINSNAQWSCPASLKYMIVRPGDENDIPNGPCMHSPDPPEPWDQEFAMLRRALRTEDWYIDVAHKCVIPKRSLGYSCYGDMTKVRYVQYNLVDNITDTRGCDPHSFDQTTNTRTNRICAAWVTVCYRLNP